MSRRSIAMKTCKPVRKPTIETLEVRQVFSNWTNWDQPLDVNADRWVTPLDALLVINRIVQRGNSGDNGDSGLGQAGVAPFVDVNGDAFLSAIDVLLIINNISNQAPLVFTKLANDTAAGGGTNNDRITADASINGRIQNAKTKDRIFAGWDIAGDQDLKDITSARTGNNFELREETITQLLGQPLTPGAHTLTIVLRRDAVQRFRSTLTFTVDRNAV